MYAIRVHQRVAKFLRNLDSSLAHQCKESIDFLGENPYLKRPGCDIKKLSGQEEAYRLRVGNCRFVYIVDGKNILVIEAFQRERGYR